MKIALVLAILCALFVLALTSAETHGKDSLKKGRNGDDDDDDFFKDKFFSDDEDDDDDDDHHKSSYSSSRHDDDDHHKSSYSSYSSSGHDDDDDHRKSSVSSYSSSHHDDDDDSDDDDDFYEDKYFSKDDDDDDDDDHHKSSRSASRHDSNDYSLRTKKSTKHGQKHHRSSQRGGHSDYAKKAVSKKTDKIHQRVLVHKCGKQSSGSGNEYGRRSNACNDDDDAKKQVSSYQPTETPDVEEPIPEVVERLNPTEDDMATVTASRDNAPAFNNTPVTAKTGSPPNWQLTILLPSLIGFAVLVTAIVVGIVVFKKRRDELAATQTI